MIRSGAPDRPGELVRLWIEFDVVRHLGLHPGKPFGVFGRNAEVITDGCGVSGFDEADCLELVRHERFTGRELPPIRRMVLNVDVSTLPHRVRDRMGMSVARGVWFPAARSCRSPSGRSGALTLDYIPSRKPGRGANPVSSQTASMT
jgi:hypothetical protein